LPVSCEKPGEAVPQGHTIGSPTMVARFGVNYGNRQSVAVSGCCHRREGNSPTNAAGPSPVTAYGLKLQAINSGLKMRHEHPYGKCIIRMMTDVVACLSAAHAPHRCRFRPVPEERACKPRFPRRAIRLRIRAVLEEAQSEPLCEAEPRTA